MSSVVMTVEGSEGSAMKSFGRFLLHRPDFVVLAVALPLFLALNWPIAAWGVVTVLWIAQFALQVVLDSKAAASNDPKRVMGYYMAGALGRGWTVATALLITGLVDRETGMYAIALTAVVFTTYFVAKLFNRLFDEADTIAEAQNK